MARTSLVTWKDLVDHAVDYLGADASSGARKDGRRASLAAIRELATAAEWSYYHARHRIQAPAPYSTGTVAYDHEGGTYDRQLTLTSGTWPSWAALGSVVIDNVAYDVATRVSDSVLTLLIDSNPGEDVDSGTSYSIYRDTFDLPCDFVSLGTATVVNHAVVLQPEGASAWLDGQRVYRGPALPRTYHIRGDPNYLGALAIVLFPYPDQAYTLDLLYRRRPKEPQTEEYTTGTVSGEAASATLTGSGTAWAARHEGAVLRVSSDRTTVPTNTVGQNPFLFERVVTEVTSATAATLDDVLDETVSGRKYVLSDLVDIEPGAMLTALWRGVEAQLCRSRRMEMRAEADRDYQLAVLRAREADSRHFAERVAGGGRNWPVRMSDMPRGSDA
jgi:hypothetical protein